MTPPSLGLNEDELVACVACGLCLPACPTYRVTGLEIASPRGRIAAMQAVQLGHAPIDDAFTDAMDHTCANWTSSAGDGSAQVGHHDRQGGGADPTSWNAAHASRGCGQSDLVGTGGNGFFYCFAVN